MIITKNSAVFLNYTTTDKEGNTLDKSPENQPFGYLHGHENIVPGLEKQLEGKSAGDTLTAVVAPDEAYGEYFEHGVQQISREYFQGVDNIQVGMQFNSQADDGQIMQVIVKAVDDDTITVDANHPLAGKQLTFDVEVVSVRSATEEEITHGHIHGEGGVQH